MPLKINQKINEILDAFLRPFWRQNCGIWIPRRNAQGAWILNLPRIRLHIFSHALLPQRGAADLIEDPPRGEHRRPTFYSRRFCRSACRRTKSFRRSRTVKGNFAWASYGGFSAGSWRVLGTFSAESRQDLGEISPPLAMKSLGGPKTVPREPRGSQRVPKGAKREPKGSQRKPKGRPKGAQEEAKSTVWTRCTT